MGRAFGLDLVPWCTVIAVAARLVFEQLFKSIMSTAICKRLKQANSILTPKLEGTFYTSSDLPDLLLLGSTGYGSLCWPNFAARIASACSVDLMAQSILTSILERLFNKLVSKELVACHEG